MGPNSAPVPTDHHDNNEHDKEAPSSSRGSYNYNDPELSIICDGSSLSDPPYMTNYPAKSELTGVEYCWYRKYLIVFRTTEALLEHRRASTLHITCENCEIAEDFTSLVELRQHCCDHHFGCPYCESATVWKTAAALHRHYRIDHFSCRFCMSEQFFGTHEDLQAHYRASHPTCPRCPKPFVFQYNQEVREHYLREHLGCPYCDTATYSEDEDSLNRHIRLYHFSCHLCNDQTVFTSQEDLLTHRRSEHGFFDCCFCCPQQPRIIWPAPWRKHMERCYYPNPCTDDFHSDAIIMIDYCDLCRKTFEPQERKVHLLFCHFCQDCARYGTIFKMHRDEHFSKCSLHGPQRSKKVYDGSQSTRANGQEQWQRDSQQDEWARESSPRRQEYFKTRANEQRASPPPPPPPTQKLHEPAPLDIYSILKVSPQSSPDEMKRAVRDRRVETHPDKRKRQVLSKQEENMIDEEAKLVGWAADVLLDPEKRQKHDEQMQAWKVRFGQ